MFGFLSGIKGYLWAGVGLVMAGLVVALKIVSAQKTAARAEATRQRVKAQGEEAARKHVTSTVEKTREVEDDLRRDSGERRRERLRDYAAGSGPDDPD